MLVVPCEIRLLGIFLITFSERTKTMDQMNEINLMMRTPLDFGSANDQNCRKELKF